MWYTYMLQCSDNSIYTGITNNLERRFAAHKNGTGGAYTRSHGAKKIIYFEVHRSRSKALIREAAIKKLKRTDKLQLAKLKGLRKS